MSAMRRRQTFVECPERVESGRSLNVCNGWEAEAMLDGGAWLRKQTAPSRTPAYEDSFAVAFWGIFPHCSHGRKGELSGLVLDAERDLASKVLLKWRRCLRSRSDILFGCSLTQVTTFRHSSLRYRFGALFAVRRVRRSQYNTRPVTVHVRELGGSNRGRLREKQNKHAE